MDKENRRLFKKEVIINTVIFMALNLIMGLFSALSMLATNTSMTAADMEMTPETFSTYGFGNVELGQVVYLCIYLALFAVPMVVSLIVNSKEQMNEYVSFKRPKFWITLGGIFGVYAINYACYIFTSAGNLFFSSALANEITGRFTPGQSALLCVILVIAPAFLEEFTFRGFVLGRLEKFNRLGALLVSALLFSVMHMTVEQIPFAFFAGLLLGYVYLRTKSIWSVIIIHGMNNLFAFIETVVLQNSPNEEYVSAVFTCIFLGLFVIGFVCLVVMAFTHKPFNGQQLVSKKALRCSLFNPVVITVSVLSVFVAIVYAGVFVK